MAELKTNIKAEFNISIESLVDKMEVNKASDINQFVDSINKLIESAKESFSDKDIVVNINIETIAKRFLVRESV